MNCTFFCDVRLYSQQEKPEKFRLREQQPQPRVCVVDDWRARKRTPWWCAQQQRPCSGPQQPGAFYIERKSLSIANTNNQLCWLFCGSELVNCGPCSKVHCNAKLDSRASLVCPAAKREDAWPICRMHFIFGHYFAAMT